MIAARFARPEVTRVIFNHFHQHNMDIRSFVETQNNIGSTALTIAKKEFYYAQTAKSFHFEKILTNANQLFAVANRLERFSWNFYKFQILSLRCAATVGNSGCRYGYDCCCKKDKKMAILLKKPAGTLLLDR